MLSRRKFLKTGALAGAATFAPGALMFAGKAVAQSSTALLRLAKIPQFVQTLTNPLAPGYILQPDVPGTSTYTINITEFSQDLGLVAPNGTPISTRLWGYGTASQQPTFPGRTFEVQRNRPVTVTYLNKLVDANGNALPHRLPVDTTLDWANPGAIGGLTPVPAVAHLHGGDSQYLSDGLPDAWATPMQGQDGAIAPNGATIVGPQSGRLFAKPYTYENLQEAATMWYHDHALGITRLNVYMGLAGFYILRDVNENALRAANVLPSYPYEVGVLVQDRQFTADGNLFYPSTAAGMPNPTHLPEFFGDCILVNGKVWPKMDVEPRKYRLRLLDASDSRLYELRFEIFGKNSKMVPGTGTPVPVSVIGNELGMLDHPQVPDLDGATGVLPIAPGERYDLIIDFTNVPPGSRVVVTNTANAPYPDGDPVVPGLTDRLMAFDVVLPRSAIPNASVGPGTNLRPVLGPLAPVNTANVPVRRILLFEGTDRFGRLQTMIGPVDRDAATGQVGTLTFKDPVTERPALNSTEVWEFYNTTGDAHPIHMHLVDFRIVSRQPFTATLGPKVNSDASNGAIISDIALAGPARTPTAWEGGKKDTARMFPGEVTRVLVTFRRRGEYVYHCHILSHEDHEMMRPYQVV